MRPTQLRPIVVAMTVSVVAAFLAAQLLAGLTAPVQPPIRFDEFIVRACLVALLACLVWAWLAVIACVIDTLRQRTIEPRPGIPTVLRRTVLLACGVTLVTTASPAIAASDVGQDPAAQVAALVAGLPLPDRTTDLEPSRRRIQPALESERIAVRPGDSLWAITERLLPGADIDDIARGWRQLYRANRALIGSDPGTIQPGMTLEIPRRLGSAR